MAQFCNFSSQKRKKKEEEIYMNPDIPSTILTRLTLKSHSKGVKIFLLINSQHVSAQTCHYQMVLEEYTNSNRIHINYKTKKYTTRSIVVYTATCPRFRG
jgi:hypothetical protein